MAICPHCNHDSDKLNDKGFNPMPHWFIRTESVSRNITYLKTYDNKYDPLGFGYDQWRKEQGDYM